MNTEPNFEKFLESQILADYQLVLYQSIALLKLYNFGFEGFVIREFA